MAVSDPAEIAVGECGWVGKSSMPRRLYRFHCLGGGDAVFDRHGRWLSSIREVRRHADQVALELMTGDGCQDWTVWAVDVRDAAGRPVLMRGFTSVKVAGKRA
ncbi:DUF6894 family protein [Methylobacterium sp. E-066]|uniref:DUF6894 family protein n=1 Tax=Methylobacterium sp. E-066 TaxID=2836584 RepID=UPI001FBB1390|nr:hypothetical protein [Methylobacterium sp. E-066]MCJ2138426.1 hypothetical protein [Methylobacterium sp. E-066]